MIPCTRLSEPPDILNVEIKNTSHGVVRASNHSSCYTQSVGLQSYDFDINVPGDYRVICTQFFGKLNSIYSQILTGLVLNLRI